MNRAWSLLTVCWSLLIVCCVSWFAATPAHGYAVSLSQGDTGQLLKWDLQSVSYSLHPQCSEDISPTSACLDELRASFGMWATDCSGLAFVEGEPSSNLSLTSLANGSANGINELAFIEDSSWTYGTYVLGVTGPYYSPVTGVISEADIAFNGLQHKWNVGQGGFNTQDVMNVAVHEIGHMVGLQHALSGYDPSNPPTMATTADPSLKSQTPEPDDYAGLCFLYPAESHGCSADTDCPYILDQGMQGEYYVGSLACEDGLCGGLSNAVPAGELGETCIQDSDCVDGLACSGGLCAQSCVTDEDCPTPYICSGSTCTDPSGSSGTGPTHAEMLTECEGDFDCFGSGGGFDFSNLGLCMPADDGKSYCRLVCMFGVECGAPCLECVTGAKQTLLGAADVCLPKDGCSERGELCTGDVECDSGLCIEQACAEACVVGDETCPQGEACARFSQATLDGMCSPVGGLDTGAECSRDDLCRSLLCLDQLCASPCDLETGEPCKDGACESTLGDESVGTCEPGSEPDPPPPELDPDDPSSASSSGKSSSGGCGGGAPPTSPLWLLLTLALSVGRSRRR
jgi:hypothetical protein